MILFQGMHSGACLVNWGSLLKWSTSLNQGRIQELGAGGGAQVRVWQGVGQSWMRSRPGEGAGGGHPSCPARGSGALPQKPTLFALKTPPKVRKNCSKNVITLLRR